MSDPTPSPPSNEHEYAAALLSSRRRQVMEDEITARFFAAFGQRMEQFITTTAQTKQNTIFTIPQEEERAIIKNACSFMASRGLAAGVTTLALLRGYRWGVFGRLKAKIMYLPYKPPTNSTSGRSFLTWGLDITVGSVVGLGVMVQAAASGQIFQDMAKIPMLPGRSSAISQQYCEGAVEEYKKMVKEYRESNNTLGLEVLERPETGNLKGFIALCQNCQKRTVLETKLRKEQNLGGDSPVFVAPPGVPEDTKIATIEDEEDLKGDDEILESKSSSCVIM